MTNDYNLFSALDDDTVAILREYGVPEKEIEGLNRYIQTIIDERDMCMNGEEYKPETILPPYEQ